MNTNGQHSDSYSFCSQCGIKNPNYSGFCGNCGSAIRKRDDNLSQRKLRIFSFIAMGQWTHVSLLLYTVSIIVMISGTAWWSYFVCNEVLGSNFILPICIRYLVLFASIYCLCVYTINKNIKMVWVYMCLSMMFLLGPHFIIFQFLRIFKPVFGITDSTSMMVLRVKILRAVGISTSLLFAVLGAIAKKNNKPDESKFLSSEAI